ncbi:MAG TPA: hypothetical protein VFX70_16605 [Mycobacteriales bacterium]|nr:hypothetical protein [Mycobacteriales bacterium]
MRQQRDELLDTPPFCVYGLASPALRPFALADFRRDGRDWRTVRLSYGNRAALAGPYVSVTTSSPRDHVRRRHADPVLLAALTAERDRAAEDSGVRQPDAPGQPVLSDVRVRLDSEPVRARLCVHGDAWAARVSMARLDVVTVGRGVRPGAVRLVLVEDLAPYWHGREDIFGLPFGR